MTQFPEIEISSASQLVGIAERYGETSDLHFRGQSAEFELLTTTIERHFPTATEIAGFMNTDDMASMPPEEFRKMKQNCTPFSEQENLYSFQRMAQHFLSGLPDDEDYCAWFALMQHHGAPTRLLDITNSIFVALYFATNHRANHDGIVYCLRSVDFTPITYWENTNFFDPNVDMAERKNHRIWWQDFVNRVLKADGIGVSSSAKGASGVLRFSSLKPSKREISQQSHFLLPLTSGIPFQDQLIETYNIDLGDGIAKPNWELSHHSHAKLDIDDHWRCPVIKLRIKRKNFRAIKIALKHMNITTESLFPDFDGLARSVQDQMNWNREVYGV